MREWQERLKRGYTIQMVISRSSFRGTVWRPALLNPDGRFVQNVRRDTVERLLELGILEKNGHDHTGTAAPDGGDQ
jgi:hypothetical protein